MIIASATLAQMYESAGAALTRAGLSTGGGTSLYRSAISKHHPISIVDSRDVYLTPQ
jgi:hypothetical protein